MTGPWPGISKCVELNGLIRRPRTIESPSPTQRYFLRYFQVPEQPLKARDSRRAQAHRQASVKRQIMEEIGFPLDLGTMPSHVPLRAVSHVTGNGTARTSVLAPQARDGGTDGRGRRRLLVFVPTLRAKFKENSQMEEKFLLKNRADFGTLSDYLNFKKKISSRIVLWVS